MFKLPFKRKLTEPNSNQIIAFKILSKLVTYNHLTTKETIFPHHNFSPILPGFNFDQPLLSSVAYSHPQNIHSEPERNYMIGGGYIMTKKLVLNVHP